MGTRKFEKLILSSAKSKDEIVAEALAEIKNYEAKDPANDYVCSVIHAYDDGDNAGDQYIVINEKLRVEYGLKGNAVASSHYSRADIKAMIDAVDAKIPIDPAKEALLKEVESIEADIRAKEAQLPPKEKELRNLKQQKATIEQEIADLNSLIDEARAEGRSTTVLEASKAQREADLAAKNKEISTLEGQISEIKRQIPLLQEQAKNKQTQQEAVKSPELATKDFVNELNDTITGSINTKDAANVKLTGNQTIAGVKTFSSPVVVPNGTDNTHAVNLSQLNTKANQATTYTKTEVDTKDAANVKLTGNQTIAGVKTFSAPPVSATNPTANNQVANKAYVDSVGNTAVKLTGNQTVAGNKTLSGTTTLAATVINGATQLKGAVTATGAITSSGNVTFNTGQVTFNNKAPICSIAPAADTNLVNRAYSKKRGGYVAVTGGAINLNNGINFSLNLTSKVNITVTNAASNIGQTGEIFVAKGADISGFSAPFNFRIAQSGFGNNEVFSYTVVSSSLVRITRS